MIAYIVMIAHGQKV